MTYVFDPIIDFQEHIEMLRGDDEKKSIVEEYTKYHPNDFQEGNGIREQIWYKEYVSKFKPVGITLPLSSKDDFDWPLFVQLVAGSLSSICEFGYGELLPNMKITVETNNNPITKTVADLYGFQVFKLFQIYIEEQMGLQNHIENSKGERQEIEIQRAYKLKKWNYMIEVQYEGDKALGELLEK